MSEILTAALRYAARGWHVFPCRPNTKRPSTRDGFKSATVDVGMLEGWWRAEPTANVAVRTGEISGIVVIDCDPPDGVANLRTLEREHGPLPPTATVRTPRDGRHLYFRHPGGRVPCSTGKLADAVDVRSDDGYALLPPSVVGGRAYEVLERAPVAAAPEWLAALLVRSQTRRRATPPTGWARMLKQIPEGERNDSIARLCGHLIARNVDETVALELLLAVNQARCRPPLPDREVVAIAESILRRHLRKVAA